MLASVLFLASLLLLARVIDVDCVPAVAVASSPVVAGVTLVPDALTVAAWTLLC